MYYSPSQYSERSTVCEKWEGRAEFHEMIQTTVESYGYWAGLQVYRPGNIYIIHLAWSKCGFGLCPSMTVIMSTGNALRDWRLTIHFDRLAQPTCVVKSFTSAWMDGIAMLRWRRLCWRTFRRCPGILKGSRITKSLAIGAHTWIISAGCSS